MKGVKTFNFIRNNSTEAFVQTVPAATDDNIQTIANILSPSIVLPFSSTAKHLSPSPS